MPLASSAYAGAIVGTIVEIVVGANVGALVGDLCCASGLTRVSVWTRPSSGSFSWLGQEPLCRTSGLHLLSTLRQECLLWPHLGSMGRTSGLHLLSTLRQECLSWPRLGSMESVLCQTAQTPSLEVSQRTLPMRNVLTKPAFPNEDVYWQEGSAIPNRLTRSRACAVPK